MIPRQLPDGSHVYCPIAGGAVFNTAIALGRLGEQSGFYGGLSTDSFGQLLTSKLSEANVDFSLSHRSDRPTTLAFVEFDGSEARYTFYDEGSAGRMLDPASLPRLGDGVSALHFGAISLIPEPCGSTYETLLLREAPDRVISLDPNIRPNFIHDSEAHRARIIRLIAATDIVKVSIEDLKWICPSKPVEQTAEEWLSGSCSIVAVTKGEEGVEVFAKAGRVHVEAPSVDVVDTVGAGDAFNAGLLSALNSAGWLNKNLIGKIGMQELRGVIAYASKVAALTVSKAGADSPWRDEMQDN